MGSPPQDGEGDAIFSLVGIPLLIISYEPKDIKSSISHIRKSYSKAYESANLPL